MLDGVTQNDLIKYGVLREIDRVGIGLEIVDTGLNEIYSNTIIFFTETSSIIGEAQEDACFLTRIDSLLVDNSSSSHVEKIKVLNKIFTDAKKDTELNLPEINPEDFNWFMFLTEEEY